MGYEISPNGVKYHFTTWKTIWNITWRHETSKW